MSVRLDPIERVIEQYAAGRPVVVADDESRENEGDLLVAAELATPALVAFMVRWTSGFLCVALPEQVCRRLDLPPMWPDNQDPLTTAYRVTVDASALSSTGISASDRAFTIRRLAAPASIPSDFRRPGHVVPLQAVAGGVLARGGHTEAAVDLAEAAGLAPAGVLAEIPSERSPAGMARLPELADFAAFHGLTLTTVAALQAFRLAQPSTEFR